MQRFALVAAIAGGCNGAVTLEITSDRPIPQAIDSLCVGIADTSPQGGQFGRVYRLEGKLASLPQTLRLEPGGASHALAWVRADRGGVPVASAARAVDFSDDVTLDLPQCIKGAAGMPHAIGEPAGPPGARLAASQGPGGTLAVAVAAGASTILDARSGALVATDGPAPPTGTPVSVIAADFDGDCADDIVIATDGAPPTLWHRNHGTFEPGATIGSAAVAAIAAADVDRNGTIDLVIGSGGSLALWSNDGTGKFVQAPAASLAGGGHVTAVSALALGDVDGDGNPDLVVGQAGAPLRAWIGGTGTFTANDGVVPPVVLDVEALALADVDGDYFPDLVVAVRGQAMRLYIDRVGQLADQSAVRLPKTPPAAHALAVGSWDTTCRPDLLAAGDAAPPALSGQDNANTFSEDGTTPAATDVVMVDIDDDGNLDALFATAQGVVWVAH